MAEASTELLPCPFCGGEATFEQVGSRALREGCAWSVGCVEEECHGYQSVTTYARKCEAATGWNTRHRIAGQAELREALEQASEWVALMWPQVPLHVRRNMADRYSAHRATVDAALSQSPSLNGEGPSEGGAR